MICPRCRSFDSIGKIKGKKVCSSCNDHARVYTFDPKRICLVDKKEPSYTISTAVLKNMFSALSNDQIWFMGYDLSNPKDFIMNHISVVPNCIRLSLGPEDSLARLYSSILRNNGNTSVVYKEYCTIIGKDSFENHEGSLINRISEKEEDVNVDDKNVDVVLNNIRNISQRLIVESIDKNNPLCTMIESGSKGSFVNLGHISSLVGQQWIRGKRPVKVLPSDRALAWCSLYDSSLQGQGFINSSYSQGLNPIEYFFYCQRGREGLVNTGVNTFDAGYIQRHISKSIQDVIV
uniref:DNA-directed RNA polymerase n=1 Tax=Physcomitrium patens TaxID=3218 RepID=A0A2K1L7U1_PHYPA|nr:hypothetical protein PHYPA_000488 [Physcomitrium patens]